MKAIVILIFLLFVSFSLCWAVEESLQEAYSLYNQGKMEEAIKIMEEYTDKHTDSRVLYFLGYAYYKMRKFDMARKYFEEVYQIDPKFVP
jgi:tetratricopeptide (TPR) repeat protein